GRALLDVGSADGLPPAVLGPSGSGAEVLLGGRRARVVEVGVDALAVETSAEFALGDTAIVYGPGDAGEPTVEDWARWAGTIGDEILARMSARIPRVFAE
ncbi:alanine racemase, partial [Schumannella luteola]